jgi:hypothetical protein
VLTLNIALGGHVFRRRRSTTAWPRGPSWSSRECMSPRRSCHQELHGRGCNGHSHDQYLLLWLHWSTTRTSAATSCFLVSGLPRSTPNRFHTRCSGHVPTPQPSGKDLSIRFLLLARPQNRQHGDHGHKSM